MSGGGPMTEEEIHEMERRAEFERAQTAAQEAKDRRIRDERETFTPAEAPSPMTSPSTVNVRSLPDAPPEPGAPEKPGMVERIARLNPITSAAMGPPTGQLPPGAEQMGQPSTAERIGGLSNEDMGDTTPRNAPPPAAPAPEPEASGVRRPAEEARPGPPMGGGGGVLIPGGMQPFSEKRTVKEGVPIAPSTIAAYGQASDMGASAAAGEHAAVMGMQPQVETMERAKLAAMDRARTEHQVLADERQATMQRRMAEIETLNKEAQGKPEDMWNSGQVFARVIGTLLSAVGFVTAAKGGRGQGVGLSAMAAGSILNGLVNQDLENVREKRAGAAAQAKRQTDLLKLHEEQFHDRDKAIDATKLAYYDNILQNMEVLKAGPYANQINDAAYLKLQANLLNERAQLAERLQTKMSAQIEGESVAHMTKPQMLGGGGARKEPGNIVTFNGTSYAMPNEKQQNEAIEKIQTKQRLIRISNDIQRLRAETRELDPVKDWSKYDANIARLNELEQDKLPAMSVAVGQGVLKEAEYKRAQEMQGYATAGLGRAERVGVKRLADMHYAAGDAVNQQQLQRWTEDLQQIPADAGGKIVREGYQVNPATGEYEPVASFTGQNTGPRPGLAPSGAKAMDPRVNLPTMPRPASETTPRAPVVPYHAASHGKKKKDE